MALTLARPDGGGPISTAGTTYIDKAWRLLAFLLRLSRPILAAELAARCRIPADLVEFLCWIPNSPLLLTSDGCVTLSEVAMAVFTEFVSRAISPSVPRVVVGVAGLRRAWDGIVYQRGIGRKRKGMVIVTRAKRERRSMLLKSKNEGSGADGDALPLSSPGNGIEGDCSAEDMHLNVSLLGIIQTANISSDTYQLQHASTIFKQNNGHDVLLSTCIDNNIKHDTGNRDIKMKCNLSGPVVAHTNLQSLCNLAEEQHSLSGNAIEIERTALYVRDKIPISKHDAGLELSAGIIDSASTLDSPADEDNSVATCKLMRGIAANLDVAISLEVHEGRNELLAPLSICHTVARSLTFDGAGASVEIYHPDEQDICDHGNKFVLENTAPPDQAALRAEVTGDPLFSDPSTAKKLIDKPKTSIALASAGEVQAFPGTLVSNKNDNYDTKLDRVKRDDKCVVKKARQGRNKDMLKNEKGHESVPQAPNNPVDTKKLPNFESFIVEDEEGSGGYGTVYRAQRKTDGKTFAIKCPHPNAHSYHVNNELKMLERFGGRSFIIKFEGSFRSGTSECFVLEHVEHDRPEVLKREISLSELQWYGFCMFRALATLHKQGIVHRDVKPGNFLFSRNLSKGYLIDFNLAMDLHHKHRANSKADANSRGALGEHLPRSKSTSSTHARKVASTRSSALIDMFSNKNPQRPLLPKSAKKKAEKGHAEGFSDFDSKNKCGSQAADASGLTSVKDATSTRTPSVERSREPIPCRGRKELINLVQEVMQSPNLKAAPTSQRKRIAAPLGKVDRMLALLTPMPLHSNGIAVSSAGMLKSRADGRQKNEGPCVGTKGFRAPEVLFKSLHQGCKVDMWSAGVTLLYLMIGRTPFCGDPEQNIKEIAKLRGSEDLWEVAKLHNRDSSFPVELFDVQSLQSMELKVWCQKNTRRPDFLEMIPEALFDLVDKCLTANPRLRISAEEALMHEFFSPCRQNLRKQKLLRLSHGSESGSQAYQVKEITQHSGREDV